MTDYDYFTTLHAKRTRTRRIVVRAVVVALVAAFFIWGPNFMIARAEKADITCSNSECAGGKAWLLFPKIVPWKHAAAMKTSRGLDRRIALRELALATRVAPNAASRDAAVARLGRVLADANPDELTAEAYAHEVMRAGADIGDATIRAKLDTAAAQMDYLRMTSQHGRLDEAIAFARNTPQVVGEGFTPAELLLMRGALLCLAGSEVEGRVVLHEAIRVRENIDAIDPFSEARLALAACGEITTPSRDDSDRDALDSYRLGDTLTGSMLDAMLLGPYDFQRTIRQGKESPFVAAAIAERERGLEETLQVVASLTSTPTTNLSPRAWSNGADDGWPRADRSGVLVDPARDEAAATRLEALAATAPIELKPLPEAEARLASLPPGTRQRYIAERATAAATLRNAARGFWLEAAGNRARAGQCELASADAKRVRLAKETSTERVYLAALLIGCGLYNEAGEAAAHEPDASTPKRDVLLLDARVQALAHAGRYDEARELAKQAFARVQTMPIDGVDDFVDESQQIATATSYLLLAMSLRTNDLAAAPYIETPKIFTKNTMDTMAWKDLIAKPEAERSKLRWSLEPFLGPRSSAARPAEMFVVGKAADSDQEVWLDAEVTTASCVLRQSQCGVVNMRARAEAARWRGDAKAEAEWLARAASVEKLLVDPKKVVLARAAGL